MFIDQTELKLKGLESRIKKLEETFEHIKNRQVEFEVGKVNNISKSDFVKMCELYEKQTELEDNSDTNIYETLYKIIDILGCCVLSEEQYDYFIDYMLRKNNRWDNEFFQSEGIEDGNYCKLYDWLFSEGDFKNKLKPDNN